MPEVDSRFFDAVENPSDWRVERPFFHVPGVRGGLRSFKDLVDGGLLRRVEACTGGKPLFAVSGIRGSVGSGTRNMWKELIPFLASAREFGEVPK